MGLGSIHCSGLATQAKIIHRENIHCCPMNSEDSLLAFDSWIHDSSPWMSKFHYPTLSWGASQDKIPCRFPSGGSTIKDPSPKFPPLLQDFQDRGIVLTHLKITSVFFSTSLACWHLQNHPRVARTQLRMTSAASPDLKGQLPAPKKKNKQIGKKNPRFLGEPSCNVVASLSTAFVSAWRYWVRIFSCYRARLMKKHTHSLPFNTRSWFSQTMTFLLLAWIKHPSRLVQQE